jgi:hypothetical protein
MVAEDPAEARTEGLRRVLEGEAGGGRTVWASFNWTKQLDVERALAQQEALAELADARQLVIKTAVLERVADGWDAGERRRAQTSHSGTISPGALVLDLAGLGRTLPVFSFPEEAEMFMRLDGLDGDWEVREGVADDFFPHFFGTRERVESVVLDPLPGAMGDGAQGPVGIGPGRFVDRFLGVSAPDAVRG